MNIIFIFLCIGFFFLGRVFPNWKKWTADTLRIIFRPRIKFYTRQAREKLARIAQISGQEKNQLSPLEIKVIFLVSQGRDSLRLIVHDLREQGPKRRRMAETLQILSRLNGSKWIYSSGDLSLIPNYSPLVKRGFLKRNA